MYSWGMSLAQINWLKSFWQFGSPKFVSTPFQVLAWCHHHHRQHLRPRYRDNRRNCTTAKSQKLQCLQPPPGVKTPVPTTSVVVKDYEEDVEVLRKLLEGKATVASSTVQSLLDATRPQRKVSAVSIRTILGTYLAFTTPERVWHD